MDAASKLATMAKGLETPLRHIPQRKSARPGVLESVLLLFFIILILMHVVMKMLFFQY